VDSDDDVEWDTQVPTDIGNQQPGSADCDNPPEMPMTEQELMMLSNATLQDELRKRNQSTNGNKTVTVQSLLTGTTKRLPGSRAVPRNRDISEREKIMWKNLLVFWQLPSGEPSLPDRSLLQNRKQVASSEHQLYRKVKNPSQNLTLMKPLTVSLSRKCLKFTNQRMESCVKAGEADRSWNL
jgi:hypothetical protein